jgi:hypothetical protein
MAKTVIISKTKWQNGKTVHFQTSKKARPILVPIQPEILGLFLPFCHLVFDIIKYCAVCLPFVCHLFAICGFS